MAIKIIKPIEPEWDISKIKDCKKCGLTSYKRQTVIGRGVLPCDVIFIGDHPRAGDDLIGEPYTGEIGKLIDQMFLDSNMPKGMKIFFTTALLCRPSDTKAGATREPLLSELAACSDYAVKMVKRYSPRHIVLMSEISVKIYHKIFPHAKVITAPGVIAQTGGNRSPFYQKTLRILEQIWQSN